MSEGEREVEGGEGMLSISSRSQTLFNFPYLFALM